MKFKDGDKVKIPTRRTKSGSRLEDLYAEIEGKNYPYLVVYDTHMISNIGIQGPNREPIYRNSFHEDDLDPYEEFPEKWAIKPRNEEELELIYRHTVGSNSEGRSLMYHYHHPAFIPNCWATGGVSAGYTEITFEQFKKHVLKENIMEKKIIGYKLTKPEYEKAVDKIAGLSNFEMFAKYTTLSPGVQSAYEGCIRKLKDAGVLDLWFEPVYEEDIKVGDWVYLKSYRPHSSYSSPIGSVKKIDKISGNDLHLGSSLWFKEDVRKATAEEIEAATRIEIRGYTAEFGSSSVAFGCQSFTRAEVLAFKRLYNKEINGYLTIHGNKIEEGLLDKIIKRLEQ